MKILTATVVALFLATTAAYAERANYPGCTADKVAVVLSVELAEGAPDSISKHIAKVFAAVAKQYNIEGLLSSEGFHAFMNALSSDDKEAIEGLYGPPQVVGECK